MRWLEQVQCVFLQTLLSAPRTARSFAFRLPSDARRDHDRVVIDLVWKRFVDELGRSTGYLSSSGVTAFVRSVQPVESEANTRRRREVRLVERPGAPDRRAVRHSARLAAIRRATAARSRAGLDLAEFCVS
jgi:hypothetical protein